MNLKINKIVINKKIKGIRDLLLEILLDQIGMAIVLTPIILVSVYILYITDKLY